MFDKMPDKADLDVEKFTVSWSAKGVGFGQFYFYKIDGEWACDNECMSREFVKQVFSNFIDSVTMED